jgi:hypothetical protein
MEIDLAPTRGFDEGGICSEVRFVEEKGERGAQASSVRQASSCLAEAAMGRRYYSHHYEAILLAC